MRSAIQPILMPRACRRCSKRRSKLLIGCGIHGHMASEQASPLTVFLRLTMASMWDLKSALGASSVKKRSGSLVRLAHRTYCRHADTHPMSSARNTRARDQAHRSHQMHSGLSMQGSRKGNRDMQQVWSLDHPWCIHDMDVEDVIARSPHAAACSEPVACARARPCMCGGSRS